MSDKPQDQKGPIKLKASSRVKALSDMMEMLDVWGEPELRELSQQLVYAKLSTTDDAEIVATHTSFLSKTQEIISARKQVEADNDNSEDVNVVTEGKDDGSQKPDSEQETEV